MANRAELKRIFEALTAIDAPSYHEREMAEYLKKHLVELGFEVYEDNANEIYKSEVGNLYAYRKGELNQAPILFSTHMDTVEPAINKKAIFLDDGRIVSAGDTVLGADCNAGTTAILEALYELKDVPKRDLELIFFIAEEKHLMGSKVFDYSKVKAKESYILDKSGSVGTAANQAPTLVCFKVKIKGKAAHAGFAPEKGINAIKVMSEAISKLNIGRIDAITTQNVGYIRGGKNASNIVCEDCEVLCEIRSLDHQKVLDEFEKTKDIFEKTALKYGAEVKISHEFGSIAYKVNEDHPSVLRFKRACAKLNLDASLEATFGGSDQSNLALHGIYGLVLASAMEAVHSCQEYSSIDELDRLCELVKALILD